MELRRRPSGSVTPRKAASMDIQSSQTQRNPSQTSFNGSHHGSATTGSSSSRRNSLHDTGSVSPQDRHHDEAGERAAKRRRISIGGKSNASQASSENHWGSNVGASTASAVAQQSALMASVRRTTRRRTPPANIRDSTATRKKIKRARRASSASTRSDDTIYDNIIVALSPSHSSSGDQSPGSGESPTRIRLVATPQSQRVAKARSPAEDVRLVPNGKRSKRSPSNDAIKIKLEPSDYLNGSADAVPQLAQSPSPRDGNSTNRATTTQVSGPSTPSHQPRESVKLILTNSAAEPSEPQANAEQEETAEKLQSAAEDPSGDASQEDIKVELHRDDGLDMAGEASEHNSVLAEEENDEAVEDDLQKGAVSDAGSIGGGDDALTASQIELGGDEDEDDQENEDEDEDDEQEDEDEDEDDDMLDAEDDDATPEDDAGSPVPSNVGEGSVKVRIKIPKLVTTTASPLPAGSEDENNVPASPASAAAYETNATGPGRPVRRLPGRRRAPHPNPKIEADLRRQLDLRVLYRAVAKQLKPLLAELAKRNVSALKTDAEAHVKATEYDTVKSGLEERLRSRIDHIAVELQYNKDKLAQCLAAEQDSQRMRYRQSIRNAQADFLVKLKHDFLTAIRRQDQHHDEHASDDEGNDVIPSLYHVNVHGRRTHILDRSFDSRSRGILETERLFNELSDRQYTVEHDMPKELAEAAYKPRPFTYLDPTDREANEHERNLEALIQATIEASKVKPESPKKAEVEDSPAKLLSNDEATNLQVLAAASASAPAPVDVSPNLAKPTIAKSSMASLLNTDDAPSWRDRSQPPAPVPGSLKDSQVQAGELSQQQPAAPVQPFQPIAPVHDNRQSHEQSQPQARVLPGFSDHFQSTQNMSPYASQPYAQHQNSAASIPQTHQSRVPARDFGDGHGLVEIKREPTAPAMAQSPRMPHLPGGGAPPQLPPFIGGTVDDPARRGSQNSFGQTQIGPKDQSIYGDRGHSGYDRDPGYGDYRRPDSRAPPPYGGYGHAPPPPDYNEGSNRNRSISEAGGAYPERDFRRHLAEPLRGLPPLESPYGSYNRDTRYDPFRRSTISSADDQARRFSPTMSNMPPPLPRGGAPNASPSLQSRMGTSSPQDRYSPYLDGRNRPPLPPALGLPPFSASPRPGSSHQSQFPSNPPTGLPPPPLPPLQPHLGGPSLYQPSHGHSQGPPPYGSGSPYSRQPLPPLSMHSSGGGRDNQGGPHGQGGPPRGAGHGPYGNNPVGHEEQGARSRTSSLSRSDKPHYYTGPR